MTEALASRGVVDRPTVAHDETAGASPEWGAGMALAAIALNTWCVEYYRTMVAAERARLDVTKAYVTKQLGFRDKFTLRLLFREVAQLIEHLIPLLIELETHPASYLLNEDAAKIPHSLRELFRRTCETLQKAKSEGLHNTFFLKNPIEHLQKLSQDIIVFADRIEDARAKLATRVPADEVPRYQEALEAYRNCDLKTEQATDEDIKTKLLPF